MDERQQKITEGAGLQESRLNQDFIDWLNRWGPRILTVVLLVLVAYVANDWWRNRQINTRDEAFFQLEEARVSGSPDALLAVARDFDSLDAVPVLARIDAADIMLEAARRGVTPGGFPSVDEDLLSEQEQRELYQRAGDLYARAFRDARSGAHAQRIAARWGMAAVAISLREWDDARAAYEDVVRFAEDAGMTRMAGVAREQLESLDELRDMPPLLPDSEIATVTPRDPGAYGPTPSPLVDPAATERPGMDLLGPPTPLLPEEGSAEPVNPAPPPAEEGEAEPDPSPPEESTAPEEAPAPEPEPQPEESGEGEPPPPLSP